MFYIKEKKRFKTKGLCKCGLLKICMRIFIYDDEKYSNFDMISILMNLS